MSERTTELTPQDAAEQSTALYQAELKAKERANDAMDFMGDSNFEDDGGEYASETAHFAEDEHAIVVDQSNEFAQAPGTMDALHEAALQEAAQRVADAYKTPGTPDREEQAD